MQAANGGGSMLRWKKLLNTSAKLFFIPFQVLAGAFAGGSHLKQKLSRPTVDPRSAQGVGRIVLLLHVTLLPTEAL